MIRLEHISKVFQAGTLSGNPVAMAAGLAQLKDLEKHGGYERLEQIGQRFEDGLDWLTCLFRCE